MRRCEGDSDLDGAGGDRKHTENEYGSANFQTYARIMELKLLMTSYGTKNYKNFYIFNFSTGTKTELIRHRRSYHDSDDDQNNGDKDNRAEPQQHNGYGNQKENE